MNKFTASKNLLQGKKFLNKPIINNFFKENLKIKT